MKQSNDKFKQLRKMWLMFSIVNAMVSESWQIGISPHAHINYVSRQTRQYRLPITNSHPQVRLRNLLLDEYQPIIDRRLANQAAY